jgi:hypothetical protein
MSLPVENSTREIGSAAPSRHSTADLDPEIRFLLELAKSGTLRRFEEQIYRIGGCENPVWLRGATLVRAVQSGLVVAQFTSDGTPFEAVPIRCMNRRASRCRSCARLYKGDTYQLVLAGLVGGKGVPDTVRASSKVFLTLTAVSFGAVHRHVDPDRVGDRCRLRRGAPVCPHGRSLICTERHRSGDVLIGSPLCPDCYDYVGHVLYNAHFSKLWNALGTTVYHRLAAEAGVPRGVIRQLVRVEYIRNAEYQARGLVHFHVALRLDGLGGPGDPPPAWATAEVLTRAITSAAATVTVSVPAGGGYGPFVFRFGRQLDVHPIDTSAFGAVDGSVESALAEEKIAGYLAKYVSKSTEDAHGVDRTLRHRWEIDLYARTGHTRALMHTAWRLGGLREYRHLNLRHWAHMLGFRGHNTTTSRRWSIARTRLGQERQDYRTAQVRRRQGEHAAVLPDGPVQVDRDWWYVGTGYSSAPMAAFAEQIRQRIEDDRIAAKDALVQGRAANVGARPAELRAGVGGRVVQPPPGSTQPRRGGGGGGGGERE